MPFLRGNGMIDWVDPSTNKVTSTLVRLETGDVLGLRLRGNGSDYFPDPIYDGQSRTFPEDLRWVQTHSFRELYPAMQMAAEMRGKGFGYAVVSSARNGWHAVLLGTLQPAEMYLVEDWKRQGLIPQDSRTNATKRFYKFDTPPSKTADRAVQTQPTATPTTGLACTAKQYADLRNACWVVFAGEQSCSWLLTGEKDIIGGRSATVDPLCSLAAQYLIAGEIDLAAVGFSLGAGVLDDLGDGAAATGDPFGTALAGLFNDLSLSLTVGGLGYCHASVDTRCGR